MDDTIVINGEEYIKKSCVNEKSTTATQILYGLRNGELEIYEVKDVLVQYLRDKLDGFMIWTNSNDYHDDALLYLLLEQMDK